MIRSIEFKFGSSQTASPLNVDDPAVTIFVGPNNAGKSLALTEIAQFCRQGSPNTAAQIIDRLTFSNRGAAFAAEELARIQVEPKLKENLIEGHVLISVEGHRSTAPKEALLLALASPNEHGRLFARWWLAHQLLILDGKSRIALVDRQSRGRLLEPSTSFQRLFTNDEKREELRSVLFDALGLFFTIDATDGDSLSIRLSTEEPEHNERALTDDVLMYLSRATPIDNFSDGVKAFTGILTQIMAGEPQVILVDEPEAFLHPSLAFKLGKEISKATQESGKKLFASTHSPQFVMGAIQSGAPVNIIRLTHNAGRSTARLLPNEQIVTLMRNPLLRSVGVISALFYDHVIVTEGDSDRAFYQEINERLLSYQPALGVPNALFLNAQNKQTIPSVVAPLRRLGIPAASIVDIDILGDGGQEWAKHLNASCIPIAEHQSLAVLRDAIWKALEATGRDPKRDGGIELLPPQEREAANNLLDRLQRYGVFAVRRGELESWLGSLQVTRGKSVWLPAMFERMGENPSLPSYTKPQSGDVWDFIASIRVWITDPDRKGVP